MMIWYRYLGLAMFRPLLILAVFLVPLFSRPRGPDLRHRRSLAADDDGPRGRRNALQLVGFDRPEGLPHADRHLSARRGCTASTTRGSTTTRRCRTRSSSAAATPSTAPTTSAGWARVASHGCVRLLTANARALYNLVREHGSANTTIKIVQSSRRPRAPRSRSAADEVPMTSATADRPREAVPRPRRQAAGSARPSWRGRRPTSRDRPSPVANRDRPRQPLLDCTAVRTTGCATASSAPGQPAANFPQRPQRSSWP